MSFIIGADISSLEAMEDYGAKYYDLNGEEGDVIKILASHGVNCIRLRLFNKPTESFDKGDYCDLKHTLRMAKRIKKYGLGFMLDFHYSDFWNKKQFRILYKSEMKLEMVCYGSLAISII